MELVRIENAFSIDGNLVGVCRPGAAGNQNVLAAHPLRSVFALDLNRVRIGEPCLPLQGRDRVAPKLGLDDLDFAGHDGQGAESKVCHRDAIF